MEKTQFDKTTLLLVGMVVSIVLSIASLVVAVNNGEPKLAGIDTQNIQGRLTDEGGLNPGTGPRK